MGYEVPTDDIIEIELTSKQSLLDADIVLFEPHIANDYGDTEYQGKPCLSDRNSHIWKEAISHWHGEIRDAVTAEKLVIVMLPAPVSVYVATGEHTYSGSGRNRATTRHVATLSSLQAIPVSADFRSASGKEMILDAKARAFAPLWDQFSHLAKYETVIENCNLMPLLRTRSGGRLVGCFAKKGKGALVLLPKIDFDIPEFTQKAHDHGRSFTTWNDGALKAGHALVSALVNFDATLKSEAAQTPLPAWATSNAYRIAVEDRLSRQIEEKTAAIAKLEKERDDLEDALGQAGQLRDLLFEQGDKLEVAILEALALFGFAAHKVDDGETEFDAVFECDEGRCIGEAEGRDNRDINITKFSQLERKIAEDFAREDVLEHAKGVLFGNPHRLLAPKDRPGDFTAKCVSAATRIGAALVRTADMFEPAKYISETQDLDYAKRCRQSILATRGAVVLFPIIPATGAAVNSDQALN